jgi:hypothetical protein
MRRLALPVAVLLVCALPAEASADIRFRGESGQNRLVTLRTGDDGMLERFGIRWRARCEREGYFFRSRTFFIPPFDEVARDRFVDAGPTRGRIGDGLRAVAHHRVVGNRVSERRWRGTFRTRMRVLRGDRLVDRCFIRTRWRVLRTG